MVQASPPAQCPACPLVPSEVTNPTQETRALLPEILRVCSPIEQK